MSRNVYIGYDPREVAAYHVCLRSLQAHAREPFMAQPVNYRLLGDLYTRRTTRRNGRLFDEISDAPMATEFSLARFWVPVLQREGWAMYCDGDFMFQSPVEDLFALANEDFAVMCVHHEHNPMHAYKMGGQIQTQYPRKNWSSLMLFNCSMINRLANFADPPTDLLGVFNGAKGRDIHAFKWCPDQYIGALPLEWNWLAGVSSPEVKPKAVHFTLGTPDMTGFETVYGQYGEAWKTYAARR